MAKKKKKKRIRAKGLTASQQRVMEIDIRKRIGEGQNPVEIMEGLNLQPHVFSSYMNRIKDIDRDFFEQLNSVDVYTNFVEKSRGLVKELRKMRKRFDYRKQFTALVASVKMEHDINKDVVKTGQELGFIEKKGNDVVVESEITFSTMTTEQVKEEVNSEIERLNNMANVKVIAMRPELMDTMGDDADKMKKFVPDYIDVEKPKEEKKKVKVKHKVKLKRRV